MNYKLTNLEDSRVSIEISGSVQDELKATISDIKKKVEIPGFRKGSSSVSDDVIISKFKENIESETLNKFINRYYPEIVAKESLDVLDQPTLTSAKLANEILEVTMEVELFPKVELTKYKDLKFKMDSIPLSEEEVNDALDYIANKHTSAMVKESGVAELDDLVKIDFKGYIDGAPFDGGESRDYKLKLGSRSFIDNFEDQIVGHKVGDSFDVNVTFPKEYNVESLKGKRALFKVELKEVQQLNRVPIDDDLAKNEGFDSLELLKEQVLIKLSEGRERDMKEKLFNKIIEKITKNTKPTLPKLLLEKELDVKLNNFKKRHHREATDSEREKIEKNSINELKEMLVIREIMRREDIKVDKSEVEEHILKNFNMKYEDVVKADPNSRFINEVVSNIRINKVKDFLINSNT